MLEIIKNRVFLNVILLISLAGFLIFPISTSSDDLNLTDITPKEASEYLELPEKEVKALLYSLISLFHKEWINLETAPYSSAEERAVNNIMKKTTQIQALNHLLKEAPMETSWKIINGAVKICRIILAEDISGVLDELEKASINKAVSYGLNFLLKNDVRVTPGAMEFKYSLKEDGETKVVFQYLIVYQPLDEKTGKVVIKFYSPNPLKLPKIKGSLGASSAIYHELKNDLPPFTIEIQGTLKNYDWTNDESINIEFPAEVPDFGIKPIGFWEKYLLKPIEGTIKEVEIIITKITGKSPKIVEAWEKIKAEAKSFISEINPFSPAALVEIPQVNTYPTQTSISVSKESVEVDPQQTENLIQKPVEVDPQPMTLIEMQEIIDDISEEIDDLSQKVFVLNRVNQQEENNKEELEDENDNKKGTDEEDLIRDRPQQTDLCSKNGLPTGDKVIFNEIAWMGTGNSNNDEWIELKNISEEEINLFGWSILNGNDKINIKFKSELIAEGEYFLLERTNDGSVSDILADFIYSGTLRNTNETLYIFDENCQMQDMISDLPQWNYGNNETKQTMERKLDLVWQTSKYAGGTPKSENSRGYIIVFNYGGSSSPPIITQNEAVKESPQQIICSVREELPVHSPIILNEIAWMGSTSSSADEWIELKNVSTSTISLNNWQLIGENSETNENKIEIIFNEDNLIPMSSYFLLERSDDDSVPGIESDKTFTGAINDSNFILRLFDDACRLIDEVTATSTWTAGQKEPERKTMERNDALNWHTSYSPSSINGLFGTPKGENSQKQEPLIGENQSPIALFNYQLQNPVINQEIIFDASSSTDPDGTITSYVWDFGNNNSTTIENSTTTYSYSNSGEYIISLQIVDDKNSTSSIATSSIIISLEEIPTLEIVINEIAWMGTSATNSEDEWIELYNNTDSNLDLTGWKILKNGENFIEISSSTIKEISTSTILAQGFYLLERTDDTTIIDIPADLIYTGILNNNGEKLELRDASGTLIDLIDCSSSWVTGTITPGYISMEKIDSFASGTNVENWANNNIANRNGKTADNKLINGTPKQINSVSQINTEIESLPFNEFDEITLTQLGNPYIIVNSLTVPNNKTLIIEPGVILKFKMPSSYGRGEGPYLKVQGNLKAIGKENEQILFTSTDGNMWPGIIFEADESEMEINSYLEYVLIEKSRSWESPSYPAVKIDKKAISIKNSTLDAYYNYRGIYMIDSHSIIDNVTFNYFNDSLYPHSGEYTSAIYIEGGAPTIKNSTFQTALYGIFIQTTESCSQNSNFKISSNTFIQNDIPIYLRGSGSPCFENNLILDPQPDNLNNVFDGIVLGRTTINYDTFWQADVPFIIERQLSIENATLTVASGITIKFKYTSDGNNRGFLEIKNGASLVAHGTTEDKIVFTSAMETPSPWNWKAIYFREGSYGLLENVEISYGGSGNTLNDCLKIETENVLLTNVEKYQCSIN
ncbi:MAG: lamin tail domain-containing protein [bacterium]